MDHSCSLSDTNEAQSVEPEVVWVILDSDSHFEGKPADSNSESSPFCSAAIDSECSVQDMLETNSALPNGCSSARTRKGKLNTELWKRNVRKRKWRNGEEHLNSSGKIRSARCVHVEGTCSAMCAYRCVQIFSKEERENIHKNFWSLNEDEKLSYYNMYTERITKQRCRTDKQTESRRKFTFRYYLPVSNEKSQVCKKFFLSTLDISEKRISYFHSHLRNAETGVHREKQSGISKNKGTPTSKKKEVNDHHQDHTTHTQNMSDMSSHQDISSFQDMSDMLSSARYVHIEDTCSVKCAYRCVHIFSEEEREYIRKNFWSLNEGEKLSYYDRYTERITKERCRTDKQTESRRKFTFRYYLPVANEKIQVCKKFFLSTLDISEKRISYYHSHLRNAETGVHREKHFGISNDKETPTSKKQEVRDHINSLFPGVCYHYCLSDNSREYLDQKQRLPKMYTMYKKPSIQ